MEELLNYLRQDTSEQQSIQYIQSVFNSQPIQLLIFLSQFLLQALPNDPGISMALIITGRIISQTWFDVSPDDQELTKEALMKYLTSENNFFQLQAAHGLALIIKMTTFHFDLKRIISLFETSNHAKCGAIMLFKEILIQKAFAKIQDQFFDTLFEILKNILSVSDSMIEIRLECLKCLNELISQFVIKSLNYLDSFLPLILSNLSFLSNENFSSSPISNDFLKYSLKVFKSFYALKGNVFKAIYFSQLIPLIEPFLGFNDEKFLITLNFWKKITRIEEKRDYERRIVSNVIIPSFTHICYSKLISIRMDEINISDDRFVQCIFDCLEAFATVSPSQIFTISLEFIKENIKSSKNFLSTLIAIQVISTIPNNNEVFQSLLQLTSMLFMTFNQDGITIPFQLAIYNVLDQICDEHPQLYLNNPEGLNSFLNLIGNSFINTEVGLKALVLFRTIISKFKKRNQESILQIFKPQILTMLDHISSISAFMDEGYFSLGYFLSKLPYNPESTALLDEVFNNTYQKISESLNESKLIQGPPNSSLLSCLSTILYFLVRRMKENTFEQYSNPNEVSANLLTMLITSLGNNAQYAETSELQAIFEVISFCPAEILPIFTSVILDVTNVLFQRKEEQVMFHCARILNQLLLRVPDSIFPTIHLILKTFISVLQYPETRDSIKPSLIVTITTIMQVTNKIDPEFITPYIFAIIEIVNSLSFRINDIIHHDPMTGSLLAQSFFKFYRTITELYGDTIPMEENIIKKNFKVIQSFVKVIGQNPKIITKDVGKDFIGFLYSVMQKTSLSRCILIRSKYIFSLLHQSLSFFPKDYNEYIMNLYENC